MSVASPAFDHRLRLAAARLGERRRQTVRADDPGHNELRRITDVQASSTIETLLAEGCEQLHSSASGRLEAEALLCNVLQVARAALHAHPRRPVDRAASARYRRMLAQRARGYPAAYLTGEREFWSISFRVSSDTHVPRPETEGLVEAALEYLPSEFEGVAVDAGTGCGAVAVALARERPGACVLALEYCPRALRLARENVRRASARNVRLLRADWLRPLTPNGAHLILANPPYIDGSDPCLERGELRYEPRMALDGRKDGLHAIRRLIVQARSCLRPGGRLLLEHGCAQARPARRLFAAAGFAALETRCDLAGHPRITGGLKTGERLD